MVKSKQNIKFNVNTLSPLHSKSFEDFAIGDILVSPKTKHVGVKTGVQTIRFSDSHGEPRDCSYVPLLTRYLVPQSVNITVEL